MLWTLCTLITALTYVDAVIVLTQTPAVHTVSSGQEVVLNCNIERYDRNSVRWYKQVPGEAPQYVLRFHHSDSSLSFGTGFSSDRFNSKSSSNIDYQFIIKQAETGDSAVYYCHTYDNSASAHVFGQGTKLIVTSSSLPPPVLTVFPPSSAELQSNTASLICLSSQSVSFADVSWLAGGGPVSSGISTSTAVQRPDQTYQISSSLTIQTSDWNMDKVYTCKVSLGSQTSEKTIKKSECPTE
ncbi:immunoglobulin lambda-1 light chain isoform X3 [Oreochromis niloticus]|uniref:Immunoglobulin lambda-1 light chain n=1 Tax=Oreochromis niloticus TaxID=8128 RepID=A0A669EDE4_ORENI|nr:immunoglobulin lambda-1 light chain isoform X3 [Oreochromis niloticus]XP_039466758.1 immunoglobulin lambda-1 light chain-like isoform X2 [Oreochromis aureus]